MWALNHNLELFEEGNKVMNKYTGIRLHAKELSKQGNEEEL